MNRASRRREKRLLKNQRLAIFFLPEIFEQILGRLPLASLHSCSLVCRQWHLAVHDILARHPAFDHAQDAPVVLSCDPLYASPSSVKDVARRLRNYLEQVPALGGKRTFEIVTSKRYRRLRYWETYAAACYDLAREMASQEDQEESSVYDRHTPGEENGDSSAALQLPWRDKVTVVSQNQRWSINNNLRHLTLLNFGFMELLSPIPFIRILGAQTTLTSLTIRMSEHQRLYFLPSLQQRSVSGAELFFTLNSLPNLTNLEIESTHRLEKLLDFNIYYYLGRTSASVDSLRRRVSGEEAPESSDWDTLEGHLLQDIPRRPHGLEQEMRQYSRQWTSFLTGSDRGTCQFKLRRLRLADVAVTEQHLLPILSRCPYLEELVMNGISWHKTTDLTSTLRQFCPRLHTLRLLRVHQSSYTLCADVIKNLPFLKTLIMDEHDIDLFEYAPRPSSRQSSSHAVADDDHSGYNGGGMHQDEGSDGETQSEDGDDDEGGTDITLRERHEAIRFYWRPVLKANMITRLVLTPTAETGRTLGQAHLHTVHCRHVMAIDLHNFLCLAPHLLHLEAPSTLLFEEMILPKRLRYQQRQTLPQHRPWSNSIDSPGNLEDMEAPPTTAMTADDHVAWLLKQAQPPTSWVCHRLHTLHLSIWGEGSGNSLESCDTSALFGFLVRTCPDLEHIALRRKALALQEGLGFGMDELAQLKRLRVLEISVNSLIAFKLADVAWIFERKKTKHDPLQPKQQQQPMSPDKREGGLHGRAMELFRIKYKTLLGGDSIADGSVVDKAFGLSFAFSVHKD